MTMHRYLVALRHADVLDALSSGETNLARAAVDAGFAHHSHLTKTLSRAFGTTPSALRLQIAAPRGADRR
jgi:AraC-like DNA-binding protein